MEQYEIVDDRFKSCIAGAARLEKLYEGTRWAEGPVWFGDRGCLLWSDIPNDRILRWSEETGVSVYRQPAGYSNGNTRDGDGRLITCQHGLRSVTRTEHDGSITVLADTYQGKRLNSPNDVAVKSDGSIWFTDPPYGIMSDYEGYKSERELEKNYVFKISTDGTLSILFDDFDMPNGIAFSPDESRLYVSDTGKPKSIRVFDIDDSGSPSGGETFAEISPGGPDGFRFDASGRLWTSAGDGVHCYSPDGELLGKVLVPETVANVEFGGAKRNRLFITATTSLYAIYVTANGARLP